MNYYNHRIYHEALSNMTPDYILREGILIRRRKVKARTLANRQRYHRQHRESINTAISPRYLLNENVPLLLVTNRQMWR